MDVQVVKLYVRGIKVWVCRKGAKDLVGHHLYWCEGKIKMLRQSNCLEVNLECLLGKKSHQKE